MVYEINIGDIVAKLSLSGKSLQDKNGNWLWEKMLAHAPLPDAIKEAAAEYCEVFYTTNNFLPGRFSIV